MKTKHFAFALLLALLAGAIPASASVPAVINYQGRLTQPSGAPVADGTYSMLFSIYDAPTGGTALWSETNPSVQVKGGLFAAMLGSVVSLPADLFDSPTRYFAVKVGSDPEMTPRQQIASVGYAAKAASADIAATVPSASITADKIALSTITADRLAPGVAIPPGTILMWSGADTNIPQGWNLCDGTNGAPDLRSRFVVGAGGVDSYAVGATGGLKEVTLTSSQMPIHSHGQYVTANPGTGGSGIRQDHDADATGLTAYTQGVNTASAGGSSAHENRPPYYALCYIMKLAY